MLGFEWLKKYICFLFVAQSVDGIDAAQFERRQEGADDDADYYEGIDDERDDAEMLPEVADPVVDDIERHIVDKAEVEAFFEGILQIEQVADDESSGSEDDALADKHLDNLGFQCPERAQYACL